MTPAQSLAALGQIIDAALEHCQPQTRALLTSAAQQHFASLGKALEPSAAPAAPITAPITGQG